MCPLTPRFHLYPPHRSLYFDQISYYKAQQQAYLEIPQARFPTTIIKKLVISLLVEALAFNLCKKKKKCNICGAQ